MQIIYISSIRWDYSWHRQQEIMSKLAEKGAQILFVQPCEKKHPLTASLKQRSENIWILTPKGFPYERCLHSVHLLNAYLSRIEICKAVNTIGFVNPIIWMDRIHGFDSKYFSNYIMIYDLVDEILSFGRIRNSKMLLNLENKVLCSADLLISSSKTLLDRKIKQSGRIGKSLFIPNGVDTRRFTEGLKVQKQKKTIIGFVGNISRRNLDYGLIFQIARDHQEWQFEFVGPGTKEDKDALTEGSSNIFCRSAISGEEIPACIASFDVGIVPYRHDNEKMDYVFPRKICEYFAAGKPVVCTDMLEVKTFLPMIHIAKNAEEFANEIQTALGENNYEDLKMFAKRFDWDCLIDDLFHTLSTMGNA